MQALIRITALTLFLLGLNDAALAAGSSSTTNTYSSDATTQAFREGQDAVDAGHWDQAILNFQRAVDLDPGDADAYNMLAFSQRKNGDLASAFDNYEKALTIEPEHRQAREYLGEAYLQAGDPDSADEQLTMLESICDTGCEEYVELDNAIAAWKAANN